uniref:Transmembrane protein n=1 Tax=Mesocestoides corti TaxID=53468 RepID=A0A5K3EKG6_MESCO
MEYLLDPLICHIQRPVKKPLFSCDSLPYTPPKVHKECLDHILTLAEESLFTWADWTISLPPSQLTSSFDNNEAPNVGKIFVHEDFKECHRLAKDSHCKSRRLNKTQLLQLHSLGQFDIESKSFPGHVHSWRICGALQKGTLRTLESLKKDMQKALFYLVIKAKDRFFGDYFSIKVAIFAFTDFLQVLFDLFIGWPHVHQDEIDRRLLEERLEFSTSDLTVKSTNRQILESFWNYVERVSYLPEDINLAEEEGQAPMPPFTFVTPSKLPIDLRLYDNQLLERCLVVINQLRREVHEGWFDGFKSTLCASLKSSGKTDAETKEIIYARGLREYATRLFKAIRDSEAIQAISPTIGEALIQQATFSLAVAESKASLSASWLAHKAAAELRMKKTHPILWSIPQWRKQHMVKAKTAFMKKSYGKEKVCPLHSTMGQAVASSK